MLYCNMNITYKQSLCSNDFVCSLPSELVLLFEEDIHNIISTTIVYHYHYIYNFYNFCRHGLFTFQKFCTCVDDTFLVLNESHDNRCRDSEK